MRAPRTGNAKGLFMLADFGEFVGTLGAWIVWPRVN
jgi:hypothetical protein